MNIHVRVLAAVTLTAVLYSTPAQSANLPFVMYPQLQLIEEEVSNTLIDRSICQCKLVCWWNAVCSSFTYFATGKCHFSHSTTATHRMFSLNETAFSFIKSNFSSGFSFRIENRAFVYVDFKVNFTAAELYCPPGSHLAGLGDDNTYNAVAAYLNNNAADKVNVWVNAGYDGTKWSWVDGTQLPSDKAMYPWGGNFPMNPMETRNRTWMAPSQSYFLVNQSPDKNAAVLCELPAV
ncbi:C-type lectin fold [Trinorchestia longiramus]|nr:C-type lectin fold [Trinorchestia longiramus]